MSKKIFIRIKRKDNPESESYWEDFKIKTHGRMSLRSVLKSIQKNATNAKGERVAPVVWEGVCGIGSCGGCGMLVNGKAVLACETFIEDVGESLILEPLHKFSVLRDLMIDHRQIDHSFSEVLNLKPLDGLHFLLIQEKINLDQTLIDLSRCIHCGLCMEACPQFHDKSPYLGAGPMAELQLFNVMDSHWKKNERQEIVTGPHGIDHCGHAQSCEAACPKGIPLVEIMAGAHRDATVTFFKKLFG
ncbi:MAG: hypothetical protein A3G32_03465 [Deltaproteobacteria bacterium RIFCSPLOWO2_12_FULL_40_28]|nr:MAG: hypothetical protein A3C45_02150 [Deltaproteobacteria bacterium RIFCSPHIGHO2_02_FULL_40_28]OGQ20152.1 MAG: hypothetical protein A3E27_01445 [Deltaproteobacteria bacterium RIFCSPHIGHO2_12_FULL_40_32]OGQ40723.1 MAG: hypothetical protein A3I69_02710 [Deltaproteobacteria bacterium RIFCSPLOWO2_02_FULL_40_36]OGQ54419.1 MAG: hypothetical protein A3G32_03465 [Deltaproteobacteria bacterium RIFCSPLOWO2_12_FULL_40_28]